MILKDITVIAGSPFFYTGANTIFIIFVLLLLWRWHFWCFQDGIKSCSSSPKITSTKRSTISTSMLCEMKLINPACQKTFESSILVLLILNSKPLTQLQLFRQWNISSEVCTSMVWLCKLLNYNLFSSIQCSFQRSVLCIARLANAQNGAMQTCFTKYCFLIKKEESNYHLKWETYCYFILISYFWIPFFVCYLFA